MLLGPDEKPAAQHPTGQLAGVSHETVEGDALRELGDVRFREASVSARVGEACRLGERREGAG